MTDKTESKIDWESMSTEEVKAEVGKAMALLKKRKAAAAAEKPAEQMSNEELDRAWNKVSKKG